MRLDLFALRQQARVSTKHFDECMDLGLGGFFQLDEVVALFGWEKVVGVDGIEGRIDAVDAANPLNEPGWIPGDVIIDDDIGSMEVNAFGKHFSGDENPILIFGLKSACIEVGDDFLANSLVRTTGEQQDIGFNFVFNLFGEIFSGFPRFRKDNEFAFL